jgi:Lipocalin-like domain
LLSATTEEKAAAFEGYLAHFGTYTSDAKAGTVAHHLEDRLVPGRRGTDNIRWFEFHGDDAFYSPPSKTVKEACSPAKTPPTNFSRSTSS